jgi:hypothetical protein
MKEENYFKFGIRIDYLDKIHEESYFFKQTINEKGKQNELELIAKEDTSLFPQECIEDYEFVKETSERYSLNLVIDGKRSVFEVKIDNENRKIEVIMERFRPKIHFHIKNIDKKSYEEIESSLDKKKCNKCYNKNYYQGYQYPYP